MINIVILFAEPNQVICQHWGHVLALALLLLLTPRVVVHLHVVLQVGLLAESSVAYITLERP